LLDQHSILISTTFEATPLSQSGLHCNGAQPILGKNRALTIAGVPKKKAGALPLPAFE
jgi:hypothetical protein